MKILGFVFLLLTLCVVTVRAQSTAPSAPLIVIRAGVLIDGQSDAPKQHQLIFVRGERIEKITDGSAAIPAGAKVLDLSNSTVLPGLIDSHTHLFLWGEDPAQGGYDANILKAGIALRAARATYAAKRALDQGFTTLRDLETEGAGYGDVEIKQAIEEGTIPGPRVFGATRAISSTGGYPLEGYAPELQMPKGVQIIDGPVEARKAAREQLDHGADWIKVYMTHRSWVDKQGEPCIPADSHRGRTESNRRRNAWLGKEGGLPCVQRRRIAARAGRRLRLDRARIGHERRADCANGQARNLVLPDHFRVFPRLGAGRYAGRKARSRASQLHETSFRKAQKAHLKIVFGTDMGGIPWQQPIAQEFSRMVEQGMAPMDAIQSATSRAAEMLDRKGELGALAPGAYADIVAVSGDPLKGIEELKNVKFVMKGGAIYKDEISAK